MCLFLYSQYHCSEFSSAFPSAALYLDLGKFYGMLSFSVDTHFTSCCRKKLSLQFVSEWKNIPQMDSDRKKTPKN